VCEYELVSVTSLPNTGTGSSNKPITWKVEDLTTIEKANRLMKNLTMQGSDITAPLAPTIIYPLFLRELHSARHLFKALPKTNLTPNTASFKIYFEHLFMARDLQFVSPLSNSLLIMRVFLTLCGFS